MPTDYIVRLEERIIGLLKDGPIRGQELWLKSRASRPIVIVVLERLQEQGLITVTFLDDEWNKIIPNPMQATFQLDGNR